MSGLRLLVRMGRRGKYSPMVGEEGTKKDRIVPVPTSGNNRGSGGLYHVGKLVGKVFP